MISSKVELFYSRQFQDREEGLARLTTILKGEACDYSIGVNKIARSATLLLHRAVRDAVFSVFNHAAETVRALFVDFVPNRVTPNEVSRCVDRLLPELLAKSGDPSARIHTLAQHTILCIAACPEVRLVSISNQSIKTRNIHFCSLNFQNAAFDSSGNQSSSWFRHSSTFGFESNANG